MSKLETGRILFILIDDDDVNNTISQLIIKNAWAEAETVTFTNARAALEFLQDAFTETDRINQSGIMFLNITMPVMTGWEFIDQFEKLPDDIKTRIKVYVLSASLDYRDIDRSRINKYVLEFFPKPLTVEIVRSVKAKLTLGGYE